jgi:hypothetical protein
MTGVEDCEKLGVAVKQALIPGAEFSLGRRSSEPGDRCDSTLQGIADGREHETSAEPR